MGELHKEQSEVLLIVRDSTHCHQNLEVHWVIPPHFSKQGIFKYSIASKTLAKDFSTSQPNITVFTVLICMSSTKEFLKFACYFFPLADCPLKS